MSKHWSLFIFLLFIAGELLAQTKTTLMFSSTKDSCRSKYILDSTGIYFTSVDCSRTTTVSFGHYTISGDRITFHPGSFKDLPPLASVTTFENPSDTLSKIVFKTRYHEAIPADVFVVDAIDSSDKFYKRFALGASGVIYVDTKRYKFLRLNYLNHFYSKWILIPITSPGIQILVNLPFGFFKQHHPEIEVKGGYTLIKKAGGLYSTSGLKIAPQDQ